MKTLEETASERELFRAILHQTLLGPNAELMQAQIKAVLGIDQSCFDENPSVTYYRLGLQDAFNMLINEAKYYER
jgi:hypothetical protein